MCEDRRFIVILSSLCRVGNKTMYVFSWRIVSVLTRVLRCCLFHSVLRISGNKHQNNTLVGAGTVRHSSTYIILYILFRTLIFSSLLLVLDNAAVISVFICWNENDGHVTNIKWMSVENAGYKVLLDYRRTEKIQRVYDHAIVIHRHNSQWIVRISSTNLHIRRWDVTYKKIATLLLQRVDWYTFLVVNKIYMNIYSCS